MKLHVAEKPPQARKSDKGKARKSGQRFGETPLGDLDLWQRKFRAIMVRVEAVTALHAARDLQKAGYPC